MAGNTQALSPAVLLTGYPIALPDFFRELSEQMLSGRRIPQTVKTCFNLSHLSLLEEEKWQVYILIDCL